MGKSPRRWRHSLESFHVRLAPDRFQSLGNSFRLTHEFRGRLRFGR
jgi:hypothetical protein